MLKCNSASKGKQTLGSDLAWSHYRHSEYACLENPRDRGACCSPWGHQERRDWLLMRALQTCPPHFLARDSHIFSTCTGHQLSWNLHARQFLTSQSLNIWTSGIEHPKTDAIMDGHSGQQILQKDDSKQFLSPMLPIRKMPGFSTSWKRW